MNTSQTEALGSTNVMSATSGKKYKAVPGPMGFSVRSGDSEQAFKAFEDIINANAVNGWKFHSMETVSVTENPGCLDGGEKNAKTTHYYMFIFERESGD